MSDPAKPAPPIRVVIVDDSPLVRHGIRYIVGAHSPEAPIEVVGEAARASEIIPALRRHRPDVVLLDIRLPDGSGIESCHAITREFPDIAVLILTSHSSDGLLYEAIVAGAKGYLLKDIDPPGLCSTIVRAASGQLVLTPEATQRVMQLLREGGPADGAGDISVLSPQERRVLALVAEGHTNRSVGQKLGLSENTVKNYLVTVFEKLNVKRRSQAAALFVKATRG
jgi:two-component system response regulator DevR